MRRERNLLINIKTFKFFLSKQLKRIQSFKSDSWWIILVVLISAIPFTINLFNYPYYENDEAVYLIRGHELLTNSDLDKWTFWYDHAPGATYLVAAWLNIIPGFIELSNYLDVGRILMLIFHVLTSILIYKITKLITANNGVGLIAVTLYSLSPLAIYFNRRLLLDNLMILFALWSLYLVIKPNLKFVEIALSGLVLGFSVLLKENGVFFLPACLYAVWVNGQKETRWMNLFVFLGFSGIVVTTYPLMAILKGELFPTDGRVSLVGTLQFHAGRGSGLPFWDKNGEFLRNLYSSWAVKDAFIIYAGFISSGLGLLLSIFNKKIRVVTLAFFFMLLFFIRGGLILDLYIIALLPFFAIYIALAVYYILLLYTSVAVKYIVSIVCVISIICGYLSFGNTLQYTKNENVNILSSINYIQDKIAKDSLVMSDLSLLPELWYKNAVDLEVIDWFWKIETDPEVYEKLNLETIDYAVVSHETLKLAKSNDETRVREFVDNSHIIVGFKENSDSYIDHANYRTTNGDWIEIRQKIKDPSAINLGWKYYVENNITHDGRVLDKSTNITTSEGQSYAMLRAVLIDDQYHFDKTWQFTKENLIRDDGLISWLWEYGETPTKFVRGHTSVGEIRDPNNAVDADLDIALALLVASEQWDNEQYRTDSINIINAIKNNNIVYQNDKYYLAHAAGDINEYRILMNPSYFSPAHYRMFYQVTGDSFWEELANDTYIILDEIMDKETGLVPDWIVYDIPKQKYASATEQKEDLSTNFSYDAIRVNFRIGLDYYLYENEKAYDYLSKINSFYKQQLEDYNYIDSTYKIDGTKLSFIETPSSNALVIFNFYIIDKEESNNFISDVLGKTQTLDDWKSNNAYYDQNWLWFAHALVDDKFEIMKIET